MNRQIGDIVKLKASKDMDNPSTPLWEMFGVAFREGIECVIENIDTYDIEYDREPYLLKTLDGSNPWETDDGVFWACESDFL